MGVKDFFERLHRIYQSLKILINDRLNERKNKIEEEKSVMMALERIEQFLIKNSETIEEKNLNLKKVIQNKYSGNREIGNFQDYLWKCFFHTEDIKDNWSNYSILEKKSKNISEKMKNFELDIRNIDWVVSCKSYNGVGKNSLDDYIEKNNAFVYFLTRKEDKEYFEKSLSQKIKNKINNFKNKSEYEVLNEFTKKELEEIKDAFKNYSHGSSSKSLSDNIKNMSIILIPYDNSIQWNNSGSVHTHHFLLTRYILKLLNKSEIIKNSKNIHLEYLMNSSIKDFFDKSEIFLIPNNKVLLENLKKIPNIKIREYDELIDFYKKIRHSFLFVCLEKKEESHSKLINIFKENNFFNLKDYYDKYLKEQNKNLKNYIEKNWITKEEIEKIDGLKLF